jgi:uncharacterized membrane protein YagU involved in acid resistance
MSVHSMSQDSHLISSIDPQSTPICVMVYETFSQISSRRLRWLFNLLSWYCLYSMSQRSCFGLISFHYHFSLVFAYRYSVEILKFYSMKSLMVSKGALVTLKVQ